MKTSATWALILSSLIVSASSNVFKPEKVLRERRSSTFVERVFLAPAGELSGDLASFFRESIEAEKGARLISLSVVTERTDAAVGKPTDVTYEGWLHLYNLYYFRVLPGADAIAIDGNATMRVRDAQGKVSSQVLAGKDPLMLSLKGTSFEIIHISASSILAEYQDVPGETLEIHFFVRTDSRPTVGRARLLTKHLIAQTGYRNISVSIRKDPWFIEDSDFPYVYRFLPDVRVPSFAGYRKAPEARCYSHSRRLNCRMK